MWPCMPLLERKLFLEHVDSIGAELPAGWEIREVPLTETCACGYEKTCTGSKNCTHCGCCTRGACRSSGHFYIHRGAGVPGMFCLDCADHVGTGDVRGRRGSVVRGQRLGLSSSGFRSARMQWTFPVGGSCLGMLASYVKALCRSMQHGGSGGLT